MKRSILLLLSLALALPAAAFAQDAGEDEEEQLSSYAEPAPAADDAAAVEESDAESESVPYREERGDEDRAHEDRADEEERYGEAPTPDPTSASLLESQGGATPGDIAAVETQGRGVGFAIEPGLQVFGQYRLTLTDDGAGGTAWFHEFDLPRAWTWVGLRVGDVIGRVLLEGTRSGGEGALIGVGGDSIVVRFREAWVGYRLLDMFEIRAGLVPQLTTPALTQLWQYRSATQIGLRALELMQPADLGASLRFDIPEGWGTIAAAYYNGEGYRGRELNRGKTLEAMAMIHPLAFVRELAPFTATLAYQMGSTGTGSARADRLLGGLAWDDPRWGLGLEATWVMGIEDRGDREGALVEAWGRVEPFDDFPLLVGARFSHFIVDTQGATQTSASLFTGAVGARIAAPLRVFVAVDGRFAESLYASSVPGFERWNVRLVLDANLAGRFTGVF